MADLKPEERLKLLAEYEKVLKREAELKSQMLPLKAKEDYASYVEYTHEGRWKPANHLLFLCEEVIDFVETNTGHAYDILILQCPPQHGKSKTITETLPSWYFGKHPEAQIIQLSYNEDTSERFTRRNKEKVRKYGKPLFGIEISQTIDRATEFELSNGVGRMISSGIMGSVTSNPAGLIVIDDPIKNRAEADSETYRDRLWEEWQNTIKTRLAAGAKIIVIMTRWHCILANTPILCYNGVKNIESIKEGDLVYTSNGAERVDATASKEYNGEVCIINTAYTPFPIKCTPEHEIFTFNGWKKAREVNKKDFVAFPIIQGETTREDILKLHVAPANLGYSRKAKLNGKKNIVTKEKLESLLNRGLTYKEIAPLLGFKTKNAVYEYACLYGLNTRNDTVINSTDYLFDEDFWWLVGMWLAEGTITYGSKANNVVRFTLSYKETDYAKRIQEIMLKYGIKVSAKQTSYSSLDVKFSCYQIAEFLSNNFGKGAKEKFLPEWAIKLPDNYFYRMLYGYWEGDGCFDTHEGYRFTSASSSLLFGFQMGLLKRNIIAGVVQTRKAERISYINGKSVKSGIAYELRTKSHLPKPFDNNSFDPPPKRGGFIKDNKIFVRVKQTAIDNYSGFVYDLQTPTHDFVLAGGIVHNCDDLAGRILQYEHNVKLINLPCEDEGNDPEGFHRVGKALFPEIGKGDQWLEEFKRGYVSQEGNRTWLALFQGRPTSMEGNLIKRSWWQYYTEMPKRFDEVIQSWDCTFKGESSSAKNKKGVDFVVGQVWGRAGANKYLLDQVRDRMDMPQTLAAVVKLTQKWPQARAKLIEGKANGSAVIQMLRKKIPGLIEIEPEGGKVARVSAVSPDIEAGNVWLPKDAKFTNDFVEECSSFPNGAHDDCVDAMSQALTRLLGRTYTAEETDEEVEYENAFGRTGY